MPSGVRYKILETSPRLGEGYRHAMARWFDYTCSDYDERAHRGMLKVDLQAIDLPNATFDVILTPHVLEHVADTDSALNELSRGLVPGGRLYLQVPLLQGQTTAPRMPEFHGDNTPVFWRFGFDLTDRLRSHGLHTSLLATKSFVSHVLAGKEPWPEPTSPEFDVTSMIEGAVPADLIVAADIDLAKRHGFSPAYMYLTWECIKRADSACRD
jgi:SAM-dependent methyltransferase